MHYHHTTTVYSVHRLFLADQGENNMGGTKGSSAGDVGYSCSQRELIKGWRQAWSDTPGTTSPTAPFGVVTLASSGSEGGPNSKSFLQCFLGAH
jgi:hypothetical protein